MDRRSFVRGMCLGGLATFVMPTVRFAQVPGRGRMVFVLLRGGFDGLAALVPYGDPSYRGIRGPMAFAPDALTPLEHGFALAPGLAGLKEFWDRGELLAVHALAIPYRTRSHFAGQAILETGLARPDGAADGWINRLLQIMDGRRSGIAVAAGLPRSLSGPFPVTTWSPTRLGVVDDAYLDRLAYLYRTDPLLHDRFEAALQMEKSEMDEGMGGGEGMMAARRRGRPDPFVPVLRATARFLRDPEGPNVAAVEFSGWDTHAGQGMAGGRLDRLLTRLAEGLAAYQEEAGASWRETTLVVMTEFGRTARPNGSGGTDHGTGGAAFVLGPRIAGSAVVADWPGLGERDLFEGRDVRPTVDTRALLKGVVGGTFDLTARQAERIFPGSAEARGLYELMG